MRVVLADSAHADLKKMSGKHRNSDSLAWRNSV